jgi:hypothetical protein
MFQKKANEIVYRIDSPEISPKKNFEMSFVRDDENYEHRLVIARRNSKDQHVLYKPEKSIDWAFSPDERFLVINDLPGSGMSMLNIYERMGEPPFYRKIDKKLFDSIRDNFWGKHDYPVTPKIQSFRGKTKIISYIPNCMASLWLDNTRVVVRFTGQEAVVDNKDEENVIQKFDIIPAWYCVYNAALQKVETSPITNEQNKRLKSQVRKAE